MMTGAPQHIEIFVTHVAEDGPLLKIWGQLDRSAATFVERLIVQYTDQFNRGVGIVYTPSLTVDQLCCAKYGEDGVYYRARIADISAIQQGYVRVNFIDYGNSDMIEISNIRSLQAISTSPLCSVENQATEFTLAGVVPPMGVGWDKASVEFIREKLCYAEFRCAIVAQISGRRLITLYYHEADFTEFLIQKNLAIRISLHAQQGMFHNLQYRYSNTQSYGYHVPPPVAVSYSNSANLLVKTAALTKQESGVISAPILSIGSKHVIYISNVEDGPNLFAVQLKATESILQNMTQTFSHVPLKPFSQSPIPGSACVSLLPQPKVLCRAVVTNLMEKECVVYCVDFGNTETVPFSQIYELPCQFLQTKSLAMRFCLAGIQNTIFDDKTKRLFQELVTGETLTLEVVDPEGPPLKQYGNIYLNSENILHVLKEKQRELEKSKSYPQLPAIQPGRVVNVTVSYVESVNNFYVQYEANAKALSKIMSTMVEYCTNSAAMIRPNELYIGMPVCALFSADQQWYRARILSVAGDQISVFYVDYGNTDTVNLVSLRQMDSNLSLAQAQAVFCSLSEYENSGTAFDDLANKFEEMTLERKLTMKIVNRLSNGKLVVELHNTSICPIVNIGLQLMAPVKKPFEETPIDEWHDPAASGEPAALQTSSSQFGKERSKLEEGGGEGWRTEAKKSGGWNESKKWGNRDDKNMNDKKWGRGDQSGEQKKWGKEEREGGSGWDNREERGGNKKWESSDRGGNEKSWERRDFNKDNSDWKDNKRFSRDDEEWKDKDNKRGFNKGNDDWKERDSNRRGFNKDGDDWKSRDNNKRGFGKDGDDWKSRDNNKRFGKDSEDRNWRKRDDQGQEDKKWYGHDDRGEPEKKWGSRNDRQDGEKKWGSRDDGEDQRKWGGRDNKRNSTTGEFKKWNGGERGNRKNTDSWKDQGATSSEQGWNASSVPNQSEEDWGGGNASTGVTKSEWGSSSKVFPDATVSIGTKENVTLVFADDPTNFVLQVDNKADDLTKMMDNIASVCESGGTVVPDIDQKVLCPCVARYSEDNAWYRAVISNAPCDGITEVHFVDYGNRESVPSSDVKEVVPEFLNIAIFGIPCSLFAVQVPVAEWSSDQVTEFLNLADGKKLEAHFIKKDGPLFEVVLFDVEEPNSSINEKFGVSKASIEDGMSKKTFKAASLPRRAEQSSSSFKQQVEPEVVYASSEDCFSSFECSPNVTDKVSVTWFINPGQFYCQCSSTSTDFTSMVNNIQAAYKGRTPFKGELAVGFPVVAQFPADKVLYRAEIKEIKGLKYQVQYVDYGNTEFLAPSNIWQIEKRFMELPKQAVECCISGIKPVEFEWPKDSSEFDRLFGAENLECTFHSTKDGKNSVSLSVNGKDVSEELVASGLALREVEERVISEERLALRLLKGQQISAHVSFIESVSKIFVHLDPDVAKSIQDKVGKHISENKDAAPILPADMVDHQMCLASPDGNQWFRGKIIDTNGTVGVCVSFIDFGDSDDIPVERIRSIPDELRGFRHQATECCVAGSDVNEVTKDFEETFKLEVEVQDVILKIEDIVNERLSVHLFDTEGQRLELLKNVDKSSPLDVEPLCPLPILTHTVRMWVSHYETFNEIWFQKECEAEILNGLLELLYNFYEEEAKGIELGDPQADQLCAAKSTKDGSWYRAKVKDVTDEQICVVYIDYGNSEMLTKEDVKELDPSFCRAHALATCASLAVSTEDHETSLAEFGKITAETVFDVSFVKNLEDKWTVHMENDETNVIHHLVKSGLVSETELLFQGEQVSLPVDEKFDVSISHFESCSEFCVQMDSNFLDILELQSTLQSISASQAVLTDTEVGALCIAQFSDEAWYRAKILEINGTSAKVHFLDYGNSYETDAKSLRKLPIKFFHWPYFAVRCRLSNELFLEDAELLEKCSELLSDTDTVFQLQVVGGRDPVLVSLFVGENELEKVVIERKEAKKDVLVENVETGLPGSEAVFVCHVSSPAKFWIQKESASSELQDLADILVQAVDYLPVTDVQVGGVYAALFEDDEQWYRAQILELCEDSYNVLFVDYGNSSVVSDLRVLPDELVNKPPVAKCCQLQVPPGVECWSTEADKKLVELSGEGTETFQMTPVSIEEPFEVKLTYNGKDVSNMLGELCVSCSKAPSNGNLTATITHINHPGEFWIHWETESSKLELVADKLIDAENFDPLEEFSDGLLCVTQFPDDEQWYRARIISCRDLEVFFIDYGNTALVTEVHHISQDLACIPPLAKRCSLPLPDGVEKWSDRAEEEFVNIFGDGTNVYKVTVLQEGDPSVISLEHNGSEVFDLLQKCCEGKGTVADKLNSSTEVEILSETEIDPEELLDDKEEKADIHKKESILKLESKVGNHELSCEVAKEILDVVLENSVPKAVESHPTSELDKFVTVGIPCEKLKENEQSVNESPEIVVQVVSELIETLTLDGEEIKEQAEESKVPEKIDAFFESVSEIKEQAEESKVPEIIDAFFESVSEIKEQAEESKVPEKIDAFFESVSEIKEQAEESKVPEEIDASFQSISEIKELAEESKVLEEIDVSFEPVSEMKENPAGQKTEQVSPKKSEVTPATKHCEQIIRDFSVEMQMPGKVSSTEGTQCVADIPLCSSPMKKLSHAERIVPGSIARGLSPIELETSPEKGKELHERLKDTLANISDVSIDSEGSQGCLETNQDVSEDNVSLVKNSDSTMIFSDAACTDETEIGTDGQGEITDKTVTTKQEAVVIDVQTSDTNYEKEANSEVFNESSPLSGSPQKTDDHDASGNANLSLDTSESNSISTVSFSSPQKDSRSTELDTEMSGDVSGSLYEDSDSSANCTLINNSFTESSKHVGIDEDKMKCYAFAQIHASEEHYESSKSGLKLSTTNTVHSEIKKASQSEPGTSVEEKED